jgi:bifunctional non-homologous end joining protein LigD
VALEEYRRKRDFKKTPEPPPGVLKKSVLKKRASNLSYLIQKHDATRLHYDFRLELDGVLLSWAVTKGPSLDPADKRLAVRTEDHPLAYGGFEGIIPESEYGGGTVMLWDRGTWEPKGDPRAGLKKGHLSFTLKGERLQGGWALVRMKTEGRRENWLLIKENDGKAAGGGRAAHFLDDTAFSVKTGRSMADIAAGEGGRKVWKNGKAVVEKAAGKSKKKEGKDKAGAALDRLMRDYPGVELATLVDRPPEGESWIHEIKFDGYRLLGSVSGGAARVRTRNGQDWTEKFPILVEGLEKLKVKDAVLDMEAVVLDKNGKSSFQGLKSALGSGGDAGNIVAFAFDLLHLDGRKLVDLPLAGRKEKLEALLKKSKGPAALRYSDHITGHGGDMIARSCGMGLEGIVSKRADAKYRAGRQKSWLKSKCGLRQEFVILGYSSARRGGRSLGALYLGYHKSGRMHYAGKVGTGFTMQSAKEIAARLDKIAVKKPVMERKEMDPLLPGEWREIHWTKPVLLCEVAFTEWTDGGHVRHPSFQGLREDKDARAVKKEEPVHVDGTKADKKRAARADPVYYGVAITHPDRVISRDGHVTKGDLAAYYAAAAPLIVPRIKGRPLTLLRCPDGIDGGECFYQRNPGKGLGADIRPFKFRHKGKIYDYFYIEDEKGLMELVQMGAIEIHAWGAPVKSIDTPDRLVFDLDPAPDVPFEAVKLAAQDLRARLKAKKVESSVKTTGGKGLHVVVDLKGKKKWAEIKAFAKSIADEMVEDTPEAYVATMRKAKRAGKIFIDYFRNDYTATSIADYAVRARAGAPVAVPVDWKELKGLKAGNQFTVKSSGLLKRLKKRGA